MSCIGVYFPLARVAPTHHRQARHGNLLGMKLGVKTCEENPLLDTPEKRIGGRPAYTPAASLKSPR